jgi:hypothetical protein
MSLKAFHIFFITLSVLLMFGFAVWTFQSYTESGGSLMLVGSLLSMLAGVGLIIYGINFLKKLKNVSFR